MRTMSAMQIDSAYESLVNGRESARSVAQGALVALEQTDDRARLRQRIVADVQQKYSAAEALRQSDPGIRFKRSWLVNTLARINDGDSPTIEFVKLHLDPRREPDIWVRYWTFEGLIAGQIAELEEVARKILAEDAEPLLTQTAHAVLASRGDAASLGCLAAEFPSGEKLWATLRALRVVPINSFFKEMVPIVEAGAMRDETYDAIIALGRAPKGSEHANTASLCLEKFITEFRISPMRDGMRLMALRALGNLGAEARAPLLIQELTDDNPSVVREAAWSLEKLLGVRIAAARVLEAACKAGPGQIEAFGRALRWMKRDSLVAELENLMDTLSLEDQQVVRNLLSEIGGAAAFQKLRASTRAVAQYTEALQQAEARISDLFDRSVDEARSGFKMAGLMDVCVFAVGLFLILASALTALLGSGDLSGWAGVGMAGGGVLGVVYGVLIAKPRKQIMEAVNHLMHVKLVFLGYLRGLHQIDQAFTRRMLEEKPMPLDEVERFRLMVEKAMLVGTDQIARLGNEAASGPAPPAAVPRPVGVPAVSGTSAASGNPGS